MKGVPADWETTLFDTGKSTLLKVTTPAIIPPEGTTASNPYTITFSSETASRSPIDTRNPVEKSAMFRPVQALSENACPQEPADGSSRCFTYTTSVYADYQTSADTIRDDNLRSYREEHLEYLRTAFQRISHGYQHPYERREPWMGCSGGRLSSGTGTYDIPAGA